MATESEGFQWANIDLLTSLMVAFAALAALATVARPAVPPQQDAPLEFEVRWPTGSHSDVDMWVQSPGDSPVGYQRPAGVHCNLVRDDMGLDIDKDSRALEMIECVGIPDGEWALNAVLFRFHAPDHLPLPVHWSLHGATISKRSGDAVLSRQGDQVTLVRFTTHGGELVRGSENHLPITLFDDGGQ